MMLLDEKEFNIFYNKYYYYLHNFLSQATNERNSIDLDGICNDAFILFNNSKYNPEIAKPITYLYSIGLNLLRAKFKKKKIRLEYMDTIFDTELIKLTDDIEKFECLKSAVMSSGDEMLINVFNLKLEGMKIKDIAKTLNITDNVVKKILYIKVRNILDKKNKKRFDDREYYMKNKDRIKEYNKNYRLKTEKK